MIVKEPERAEADLTDEEPEDAQRQSCVLCGSGVSEQTQLFAVLELLPLKTKSSASSVLSVITKIVGTQRHFSATECLCGQCFNSLNLLDELNTQAQQLQNHLILSYRSTQRKRKDPPLECSDAVRTALSQPQLLQSGITIDATPSLSLTYVKASSVKRRRVTGRSAKEYFEGPGRRHCCDYVCSTTPASLTSRAASPTAPLSESSIFDLEDHNTSVVKDSISHSSPNTILRCSVGDLRKSLFTQREVQFNNGASKNAASNESISRHNASFTNSNHSSTIPSNPQSSNTSFLDETNKRLIEDGKTLRQSVASLITPSLKNIIHSSSTSAGCLSRLDDSVQVVSISRQNGDNSSDDGGCASQNDDDDDDSHSSDSSSDEEDANTAPPSEVDQNALVPAGGGDASANSVMAAVAQAAMILSNPEASSLLQSFLTASLWMTAGNEEESEHLQTGSGRDDSRVEQNSDDEETEKLPELSDDVTRESLNAVAATLSRTTRRELKNTGQSYINTRGKMVEAKRVAPQDCSKCVLRCSAKLSESDRQTIFAEYWGLADYAKQREYLAEHMHREEKLGPSGLTRTVVLYYLTHEKKVQVCRQFFLKTLCVSEKASRIVLEKKVRGDFGKLGPPPPAPSHRTTSSRSKRTVANNQDSDYEY